MITFIFWLLVVGFICGLVHKYAPVPDVFKYVAYGIAFFWLLYMLLVGVGLMGGDLPMPHKFK